MHYGPCPQWTFFFLDHLGVCVGEEKEFCEEFNQVVCKSWTLVISPGWWGPLGWLCSSFLPLLSPSSLTNLPTPQVQGGLCPFPSPQTSIPSPSLSPC